MKNYKGFLVTTIIVAAPLVWLVFRLSAIKTDNVYTSGDYIDMQNVINQVSENYINESSGETSNSEKSSGESVGSKYGTPISKIIENAKINVSSVNVYAEPDEESGVIGSAYKDIPLAVQDYPNGWSMIKIDELSGWVKTEFITKPEEASSTANSLGTVVGKKAKITVTSLRVRSSGTSNVDNVIDVLDEGAEVKIIGANDDESWLQVQYGTKSGWISGNTNYIKIID
jgi:uncharacterized protein YgiM (DUF1202 family)